MSKKIKFYLIAGIVAILGIVLIFNQILTIGLVILGIAALIYITYEFLLKGYLQRINNLGKELNDAKSQNKLQQQEIDDYSNRKLNISEINSILELGLFEVNTSFKRTVNQLNKDGNVRFIGVLNVNFIAKYGVDFRKLKYKVNEAENEISISNAIPEFLAFSKRTCTWEIDEILEFHEPMFKEGYWRTNPSIAGHANKLKEDIRVKVERETENGPEELKWIINPLKKHVERALEIIIGAQGYKIGITELDDESYKPLTEYNEQNGQKMIETQIIENQ